MVRHRLHSRWSLLFVTCATTVVGCGGGSGDDAPASATGRDAPNTSAPSRDASPPPAAAPVASGLPAHNPEATYSGKTAAEWGAMLSDLNPEVQGEALAALGQFGVDALPAREQVRAVVTSRAPELIRFMALATLQSMEDPDAGATVLAALADPGFSEDPRMFGDLIQASLEIAGEEAVHSSVLALAGSDPAHATTLMITNQLPAPTQTALEEAIFNSEHDGRAVTHFLARLTALEFLDDAARVAYINAHRAEAAANLGRTQQALLAIGTEEAMDLTLTLLASRGQAFPQQTAPVMRQFVVQGKVAPQVVISRMAEWSRVSNEQSMIEEPLAQVNALIGDLRTAGQRAQEQQIAKDLLDQTISNEEAREARARLRADGPDDERYRAAEQGYVDLLHSLVREGPSETHQAVGVLYLVPYAQSGPADSAIETLEPVFEALSHPSTPDVVRATAGQQLQQTAPRFMQVDPQGFVDRIAGAMWAGADVNATHFPEQILIRAGMQPPANRQIVVNAVAAGAETNLETWAVNPGCVVLLNLLGQRGMENGDVSTAPSIALGKMLASRQTNLGYIQNILGSKRNAVMGYTSLEGLIGILEPSIFADFQTVNHQYYPDQFAGWMMNPLTIPAAVREDPAARERWRAFLQRVVDKNDPAWSKWAQMGLDNLARL
jgi:hypothetical protein